MNWWKYRLTRVQTKDSDISGCDCEHEMTVGKHGQNIWVSGNGQARGSEPVPVSVQGSDCECVRVLVSATEHE